MNNNVAFSIVLLLSMLPFTAQAQESDNYPVTVHVSSSRWVIEPSVQNAIAYRTLNVLIDGKKCELATAPEYMNPHAGFPVLALGDYKAKLIRDEAKAAYERVQTYELLLPDKKTLKFYVVGVAE